MAAMLGMGTVETLWPPPPTWRADTAVCAPGFAPVMPAWRTHQRMSSAPLRALRLAFVQILMAIHVQYAAQGAHTRERRQSYRLKGAAPSRCVHYRRCCKLPRVPLRGVQRPGCLRVWGRQERWPAAASQSAPAPRCVRRTACTRCGAGQTRWRPVQMITVN